jgi:hypothetical protein
MPAVPAESAALVNYVSQQEAAHKIKPDNEARVIWANDSLKNKTEYALVYLHGFTASQGEGDPVHRDPQVTVTDCLDDLTEITYHD